MDKRKRQTSGNALFSHAYGTRHLRLFLAKYLAEEAHQFPIEPAALEKVTAVLGRWADAADAGRLDEKETELDAEFLQTIFGEALGYKSLTESADGYNYQ